MRENRSSNGTLKGLGKGWGVAAICMVAGAMSLAQAQSNSPFAHKKKKQAWETPASSAPPVASGSYAPPSYSTPSNTTPTYSAPKYSGARTAPASPSHQSRTYGGPASHAATPPEISPRSTPTQFPAQSITPSYLGDSAYDASPRQSSQHPSYQAPYASQAPLQSSAPYSQHSYGTDYLNRGSSPTGSRDISQGQYPQRQGQYPQTQYQQGQLPRPQGKRSWAQRLGFGNLATTLTGYLKIGAAITDNDTRLEDGIQPDFIADGSLRGEVSAITQGGLEYGLGARVRAQYDADRRGFGGRVGDCPPALAECASVTVNGLATALRGHSSQFYSSGPSIAEDVEFALEGAYVFLRSAYGDISIGRDEGSAYLFSLGAPSLVAVGASNSPVDYTGLDSVKTVNQPSGFSEKIAYTSPRLLGDQIGVGVQFGVSYAPNPRACGVDYCVRRSDASGALSPDLEDVIEAGLALDRTFKSGVSVEATATYATASEQSGLAGFDDLKTLGLGLELGYGDWKLGGSYLDSNNGLQDGDYTAYDIGLTWQPAAWGVTAGYGHARDENVDLTSNQGLLAVSYDFGKYRLGTGVQYIERRVPVNTLGAGAGLIERQKEKSGALFVEGSVRF